MPCSWEGFIVAIDENSKRAEVAWTFVTKGWFGEKTTKVCCCYNIGGSGLYELSFA